MPALNETPMCYGRPAELWPQALPVGNGRLLGAMVFGDPARERLLTESTLWSGAPGTQDVDPSTRDHIPSIRELLFARRYTEAEELCRKHLLWRGDQFGTALPLAFLEIETVLPGEPTRYRRSLDLGQGHRASKILH